MKALLQATAICMSLICNAAFAQSPVPSALDKAKASGTLVMGVRESGGAVSFTLGDNKYTGFHVELCQRIIAEIEKQVGKKSTSATNW